MADDNGPSAGPVNTALLDAFEPYLDAIADRLAARLTAGRARMINQHDSELGPRRHRDAVKRRIANDEGGAGRAGRNYLLTKEAVREELARPKKPRRGDSAPEAAPTPRPDDRGPASGASPSKSRARELADFEKDVMSSLNAVKGRAGR